MSYLIRSILILGLLITGSALALEKPLAHPLALDTYIKAKLHRILHSSPSNERVKILSDIQKELLDWQNAIAKERISVSPEVLQAIIQWQVDLGYLKFRSTTEVNKKNCDQYQGDILFGYNNSSGKNSYPESARWALNTLAIICQNSRYSYQASEKSLQIIMNEENEMASNEDEIPGTSHAK